MQLVLKRYGLTDAAIRPIGSGLINSTWLVEAGEKRYVLQQINQQVFKHPADIAFNINFVATYLRQHHPGYLFPSIVKTLQDDDMAETSDGFFRMFDYLENTQTFTVVEKPGQAFEAARQFGKFSKLLGGLNVSRLKITLPDFHDLSLRYSQFENALAFGNKERIEQSAALISLVIQHQPIVDEFEKAKQVLTFRCMHHDTKISNVLFDENGKAVCVIDLDTMMPGYFISDVGDMMRTYLCPVTEEEQDFSKIEVRKDYYDAIVKGYLSEMGGELSDAEQKYFHFSGMFMIYMQAVRFLTDHLNNDVYYGAKYPGHNFVRAGNQLTLLERYLEINPG